MLADFGVGDEHDVSRAHLGEGSTRLPDAVDGDTPRQVVVEPHRSQRRRVKERCFAPRQESVVASVATSTVIRSDTYRYLTHQEMSKRLPDIHDGVELNTYIPPLVNSSRICDSVTSVGR